MIILPDGAKIEMQWKQATYMKEDNYVVFEIVPMLTEKDIIIFPNQTNWLAQQKVFSEGERKEIMFLLERITWKRDFRIVEADVFPYVNERIKIDSGMLEQTEGYIKLTKESLFDVESKLNKEQVKEIYCKLERKFAEAASGLVKIPKELLINGSVFKELVIPILEKNINVQIELL